MKVGIKFLVVLAILVIGYVSLKKKTFTDRAFTGMFLLTFTNIILAYLW
jgi:hypothetical protein